MTNKAKSTLSKRSIETLIPYANNARTHSDEQVAQIASSIREFGFINPVIGAEQRETQSNPGGLTEIYKEWGTYVKSMYSVIAAPDAVTVQGMGAVNRRMHHRVSWKNAVPKLLEQKYGSR